MYISVCAHVHVNCYIVTHAYLHVCMCVVHRVYLYMHNFLFGGPGGGGGEGGKGLRLNNSVYSAEERSPRVLEN